MLFRRARTAVIALTACLLAGCAGSSGNEMATASIPAAPKADPVCSQLATQIAQLRGEGVATKVENAAAKKYKMKPADLSKAAQLNKANEDYQARCGTVPVQAAAPLVAPVAKAVVPKQAASVGVVPAAAPAVAAAPKEVSPASAARAADAAAARALLKSSQLSSETQLIGN